MRSAARCGVDCRDDEAPFPVPPAWGLVLSSLVQVAARVCSERAETLTCPVWSFHEQGNEASRGGGGGGGAGEAAGPSAPSGPSSLDMLQNYRRT